MNTENTSHSSQSHGANEGIPQTVHHFIVTSENPQEDNESEYSYLDVEESEDESQKSIRVQNQIYKTHWNPSRYERWENNHFLRIQLVQKQIRMELEIGCSEEKVKYKKIVGQEQFKERLHKNYDLCQFIKRFKKKQNCLINLEDKILNINTNQFIQNFLPFHLEK